MMRSVDPLLAPKRRGPASRPQPKLLSGAATSAVHNSAVHNRAVQNSAVHNNAVQNNAVHNNAAIAVHPADCAAAVPAAAALAQPGREDALQALRTLLRYLGEDPAREGLLETPDRVLRAYDEFFAGYREDPAAILSKTFDEEASYTGPVLVRDIELQSHCEHHMVAFTGCAHIAYLPAGRIVGLSKLARLVDAFARRLQIQERLTAQIATALQQQLQPLGTLVVVEAEHHCMATRGVRKRGSRTVTTMATGIYQTDALQRQELLRQLER